MNKKIPLRINGIAVGEAEVVSLPDGGFEIRANFTDKNWGGKLIGSIPPLILEEDNGERKQGDDLRGPGDRATLDSDRHESGGDHP